MRIIRILAVLFVLLIGMGVFFVAKTRTTLNSLSAQLHRICSDCGLSDLELARLIVTVADSDDDREVLLKQLNETLGGDQMSELCMQCGEAILSAGGGE